MKNKKEENKKVDVQKRLEELDLGEVLEKKANRKRLILIATITLAIIVVAALVTLNHFYGNKAFFPFAKRPERIFIFTFFTVI